MYYQLYIDGKDYPSKTSFDPEEPALGRIDPTDIERPYDATSIRRYIAWVEQKPALAGAYFYTSTSEECFPVDEYIALDTEDYPGPNATDPLALVLPYGKYTEKCTSLMNRGKQLFQRIHYFYKTITEGETGPPHQLDITTGEVLYTDGRILQLRSKGELPLRTCPRMIFQIIRQ